MYNDTANQKLYSIFSGNNIGLEIDINNRVFSLGDYGVVFGGQYIKIDDVFKNIQFNTDELIFNGAVTNNTGGWTSSGRYLEVTINGVGYYIDLLI